MGAMNDISLLAKELDLRTTDFHEMKIGLAKRMLTYIRRDAPTMELARILGMENHSSRDLENMVWLNREQAVGLPLGTILHHVKKRNRDGSPMRVRVTGKCQTWVRKPHDFRLPVKYGMYESGAITADNRYEWYVA